MVRLCGLVLLWILITNFNNMKKEDLLKKIGKLEERMRQGAEDDIAVREELAKAFKWFKKKDGYSYEKESEPILPSWVEIFIHIGRLLNTKDFHDYQEDIYQMHEEMQTMHATIRNIHENRR